MNHPRHIVTAAGLVTRDDGKVVVLENARGEWEFPGGQVEEGEAITEALKREIEEETGVLVEVGQLVGVYSRICNPPIVNFTFLCKWVSGELRASEESMQVIWESRGKALAKITKPQLVDRMNDMFNFDGKVTYQAFSTQPYKIHEHRII